MNDLQKQNDPQAPLREALASLPLPNLLLTHAIVSCLSNFYPADQMCVVIQAAGDIIEAMQPKEEG